MGAALCTGLVLLIFVVCLAVYFWLMSLLAFLAFRRDKESAINGGWRVPEMTLLTLALIGGWAGAKWAQHRFRHKTRKEPFRSLLNACLLGPVLIAALGFTALFQWQANGGLPTGLHILADNVVHLVIGEEHYPIREEAPRSVIINRGGVRETVIFGD